MSPASIISRRAMLKLSGGSVLALTVPLDLAAPTLAAPAAPAQLRRSSWAGLVGSLIPVVGGPALRLVDVADLSRAQADPGLRDLEEAFVLTFRGPVEPTLGSGIAQLQHPELGTVSLFLSPVDTAQGGQRYEALVDRTVRLASVLDAPAFVGSAEDAAAGAAASTAPVVKPAIGGRSLVARRLKVRARARRDGRRLAVDLSFVGGGIRAARVQLVRHGRSVATGEGLIRHGRALIAVRSHVPRGSYDLVVTATDRHAAAITVTRSVTVR